MKTINTPEFVTILGGSKARFFKKLAGDVRSGVVGSAAYDALGSVYDSLSSGCSKSDSCPTLVEGYRGATNDANGNYNGPITKGVYDYTPKKGVDY